MFLEILISVFVGVAQASTPADLCQDEVKNLECTVTYNKNGVTDIQEATYSINKDTTFFCPSGTPGNDVDETFPIKGTTFEAKIYSSFEFMRLTIIDTAKSTTTPLAEAASIPPFMMDGMNLFSSVEYNVNDSEYVLVLCTAVE